MVVMRNYSLNNKEREKERVRKSVHIEGTVIHDYKTWTPHSITIIILHSKVIFLWMISHDVDTSMKHQINLNDQYACSY